MARSPRIGESWLVSLRSALKPAAQPTAPAPMAASQGASRSCRGESSNVTGHQQSNQRVAATIPEQGRHDAHGLHTLDERGEGDRD